MGVGRDLLHNKNQTKGIMNEGTEYSYFLQIHILISWFNSLTRLSSDVQLITGWKLFN